MKTVEYYLMSLPATRWLSFWRPMGYLASLQTSALQCTIHQGVDMGHTAANGESKPSYVTVGGNAVVVGRGVLEHVNKCMTATQRPLLRGDRTPR